MEDVEEIVRLAKKWLLEQGHHLPMVFLKGKEGKETIVLENFGATDEKQKDMLNAGTFAAFKHNIGEFELLVFVSEAVAPL